MAKQWGNVDGDETLLPNWFVDTNVVDDSDNVTQKNVDRPHHPNSNQEIAASDKGWERTVTYVDSNGNIRKKSEVLVAQGKLATTFVKPAIVDVSFDKGAYTDEDQHRVNVRFSENVKVDGTAPKVIVTYSGAGDAALTYDGSSGNEFANNVLSFSRPSPASATETMLVKLGVPITDFDNILGVTTGVAMVTEDFTAAHTDGQKITLSDV